MYFEKAKDWENESEFRFAIFECGDDLYFSFTDSLEGIVFGQDCSEQDISAIVGLTKNQHIDYQKLNWRNCTPWLEFERLKW